MQDSVITNAILEDANSNSNRLDSNVFNLNSNFNKRINNNIANHRNIELVDSDRKTNQNNNLIKKFLENSRSNNQSQQHQPQQQQQQFRSKKIQIEELIQQQLQSENNNNTKSNMNRQQSIYGPSPNMANKLGNNLVIF